MWNRLIEGIYILHQVVALNINYLIYIQYTIIQTGLPALAGS